MQTKIWVFVVIIICFTSQMNYGQQKQFLYDGEIRTYIVHDPFPGSGTRPLVVGLHCISGTAAGLLTYTGLIQKAKDENFIGVFPNSLSYLTGTQWNAGGLFEYATGGTDDVGFISALIDTMIKNYDIDTTRIYVTGHSNGSAMSYRVAAELSHRVAAMGAVAGQMVYQYCDPEFPVPIIHFHGLSDSTAPYLGLTIDTTVVVPSVESVMNIWCGINNCNSIPDTIMNENGIIGRKWASPNGKNDIVLYTIETCMHDWPTYDTYGISATDVIWDFMKLHTRVVVTHIEKDDRHPILRNFELFQNYPNPFNPSTKIKYQLNRSSYVKVKIFNIAGQEIEILANEFQSAGEYKITWQPKGLPSGIYFYRLQAGDFSETKKLILQK